MFFLSSKINAKRICIDFSGKEIFKLTLMVKLIFFSIRKLILNKINKIDIQYFKLIKTYLTIVMLHFYYFWFDNLL